MLSGKIPEIPSSKRIFLGVDIGFVCHLTLSFDDDNGSPVFFLFETVPVGALEDRVRDLRQLYNIVQGGVDRFPFEPNADALRVMTTNLLILIHYPGNPTPPPVPDQLRQTTPSPSN